MYCLRVLLVLVCVLIFPLGQAAAAPLQVTVSVVPQAYFVRQIAHDLVQVSVMVLPGASPATYEPKPNQMKALSSSAAYFAVGAPFETTWLDKICAANPNMLIVRTQEGITKVPMARHHHDLEASRDHDQHHESHAILDPHIWLAPDLVAIQARNICKGLVAVDPDHKEIYETNLAAFEQELTRLDTRIRAILGDTSTNNRFLIFHPAWGYFARAYGLRQIPVEMEGKSPSPKDLSQLIQLARSHDLDTVFVQPQFSQKSAVVIAGAINGRVVRLDPLAKDWATNLVNAATSIKEALR
ncbi:metal ABC transporter solute-binding protein, Zn/Mn family [Desulfoplanes formicivorans]|uniref:Cation ABC transporter substrate-binding protein n=1 Tax=Desulfoplanes formicivorans TaxID=1592317 RepID=A0A194AK95_9BACT|nr:zinc ABC transporter substrate-binding protein [Desulfoplanes formicivorans]GAU09481.1 cation ABC transporter substrate-binding protein [Desulfoplanes formicivorans]